MWFDITMDHAVIMSVLKSLRRLLNKHRHKVRGKRQVETVERARCQHIGQGAVWNILHGQIVHAVLFTVPVDRKDVRMLQCGNGSCFLCKANIRLRTRGGSRRSRFADHLNSHLAAEIALFREVDVAHTAVA